MSHSFMIGVLGFDENLSVAFLPTAELGVRGENEVLGAISRRGFYVPRRGLF